MVYGTSRDHTAPYLTQHNTNLISSFRNRQLGHASEDQIPP